MLTDKPNIVGHHDDEVTVVDEPFDSFRSSPCRVRHVRLRLVEHYDPGAHCDDRSDGHVASSAVVEIVSGAFFHVLQQARRARKPHPTANPHPTGSAPRNLRPLSAVASGELGDAACAIGRSWHST